MQVGDLVWVGPSRGNPCVVVSMTAYEGRLFLKDCVSLYIPEHACIIPMNKKYLCAVDTE